jgi:hypothetical protein
MDLTISTVTCHKRGHTLTEGIDATDSIIRIIRIVPPPRFGLLFLFLFLLGQHRTHRFIERTYLLAMLSSQDPVGSQDHIILLQLDSTVGSFSSPVNEHFTTTSRLGLDLGLPSDRQYTARRW